MFCFRATAATALAVVLCANLQAIEPQLSLLNCTEEDPPSLQCNEKLRIELALGYEADQGPLTFTVTEADGRALERPVEVQIEQIETKFIYPLNFLHNVPYHPVEEVILVQNVVMGIQKCIDDPGAAEPTCGWAYEGGRRIEHSQGFCCNKPVAEFGDRSTWRGEETLGRESNVSDWFSTAHCFRPGVVWFSGFDLDPPIIADGIIVRITTGNLSKQFTLSHASWNYQSIVGQQIFIVGRTLNISGRASYPPGSWKRPSGLEDSVLYIPESPANHPFMEDILRHAMLVGRDQVDDTGKVCDKIGIDYDGFRHQQGRGSLAIQGHESIGIHGTSGGKKKTDSQITTDIIAEEIERPPTPYNSSCSTTKADDCLHNQLFHKHEQDQQILATNPESNTQYLIRGMSVFKDAMFTVDNETFEFWNEAMRRAHVIIEIDARHLFPSDSLPVQIDHPVGPIKPKS